MPVSTPALSLRFPYYLLLFKNKIKITRNLRWDYRGPLLLCQSLDNDSLFCHIHNINPARKRYRHKQVLIVGTANLANCYSLAGKEKREERMKLFLQYNPHASNQDLHCYFDTGYVDNSRLVTPGSWFYHLTRIRRLPEPFVVDPPRRNAIFYLDPTQITP